MDTGSCLPHVVCYAAVVNNLASLDRQPTTDHNPSSMKHFVLDTNVLLHNPNALFMFGDNEVVIPFDVIEELDSFKTNTDDLGRNARTVIRHLDRLRAGGSLADGIDVKE